MPQPSSPPPQHLPHEMEPNAPDDKTVVFNMRPTRKPKRPTLNPPSVPTRPLPANVHLSFSQSFKKQDSDEVYENEVISSLEFNHTGDLLAVGDKGGVIQVYKKDATQVKTPKYSTYVTFQSHLPEFDYLKSIEIEEKIAQIKWLRQRGPASYLLSSNDRTIKLWRIGDHKNPDYSSTTTTLNNNNPDPTCTRLVLPRPLESKLTASSHLRKSYVNGHAFHINSISVNSDDETFASSDDLRVNLWHVDRTDSTFVVVDIKPESMETLTEVITACTFHPKSCNILSYSTSKGSTNLCDLRSSSTCDNALKSFWERSEYSGYYSEVVASISDAQFSNCGTFIGIRDFMSVKVWDTRMETTPVLAIPVHEYLRPHLSSLFEDDLLFDRFSVSWNHNDTRVVSGSYHDFICVGEVKRSDPDFKSSLFQVSDEYKNWRHHVLKPKRVLPGDRKCENALQDVHITDIELTKRVLHSQWHPQENLLAVAASNQLCLFSEKRLFM